MKPNFNSRLAMLLAFTALAFGTTTNAQEEKKNKRGRGGGLATQVMNRFKGIEFSAEQKTKIKEISKKFSAKFTELRKASNGLLTAEQRKTRSEAMSEARKAGKKFPAATEAANKAAGISADIAAKMQESQKKMQAIQKEISESIMGLLTDEQKATMKKSRQKGRKGPKKDGDTAKTAGQVVSLKLPNMT